MYLGTVSRLSRREGQERLIDYEDFSRADGLFFGEASSGGDIFYGGAAEGCENLSGQISV